MPYKVTAVRHVPDASRPPEERLEPGDVLAELVSEESERIAIQRAYELATNADAEHVLLTPLVREGKGWRPNADPNALTRRTLTMFRTHDESPVRVHVEQPAGI